MADRQGPSRRRVALRQVASDPRLRLVVVLIGAFTAVELGAWVAITAIAYEAGGVDLASKLLVAQLVPAAVVALGMGRLIERWGTTRVIVTGFWGQSVGLLLCGAALLAEGPSLPFYAGAVIAASSVVAVRPAITTALPTLVGTQRGARSSVSPAQLLTAANVGIGWATAAAALIGPLIVAATIGHDDALPILIFAAVTVGAGAASLRLPTHRPGAADSSDDAGERVALTAGPMPAVIVLGAAAFILGCLDLLYVVVATELLDGGAALAGWLSAAGGLGALVGGATAIVLVGRRSLWPWLLGAVGVSASALVALGLTHRIGSASMAFAAIQAGVTFLTITARTLLQRMTPSAALGRLSAVAESAEMVMLLVAALLVPGLVNGVGPTRTCAFLGLVLAMVVAVAAVLIARSPAGSSVVTAHVELLQSTFLLALLPGYAIESLAADAEVVDLDDGERLFREGDWGDLFYVVVSGEVVIDLAGETRRHLARGDGFGERALTGDGRRTAGAVAHGPTSLLAISGPSFLEAVTGHVATEARHDDVRRIQDWSAAPDHPSGD